MHLTFAVDLSLLPSSVGAYAAHHEVDGTTTGFENAATPAPVRITLRATQELLLAAGSFSINSVVREMQGWYRLEVSHACSTFDSTTAEMQTLVDNDNLNYDG